MKFKIPPITLNLIIINVLCWLIQIIIPSKFDINITDMFGLHYWISEKFHWYQLITNMFLHDTHGMSHLFFNMFGLFMFGTAVEEAWGGKKFLFFYLFTGIGASITQELSWLIDSHALMSAFDTAIAEGNGAALVPFEHMFIGNGSISYITLSNILELRSGMLNSMLAIGASGALFGVLLAFAWLFPKAKMGIIFVPIMIPARIFVAIYTVIELVCGVANFSFDSIAHYAHLGGMLFGLILILIWKKFGNLYSRW